MFWTVLLGIATGMRTMTAVAVICWSAYLGYLPVQGTWAAWSAKLVTVIVMTTLALGEYVGDTLPRTPRRTDAFPLISRLIFGVLVGLLVATSLGEPKAGGVILGVVGALIGAYGGVRVRLWCGRHVGRDLPVALMESALALGFSVWAVSHLYLEIVGDAYPSILLMPR